MFLLSIYRKKKSNLDVNSQKFKKMIEFYWIYSVLFKGGFSSIKLIQSKLDYKFYIIKIVKKKFKIDIENELICLKRLRNNSITPDLKEHYESNSSIYLVLSLCQGISLRKFIDLNQDVSNDINKKIIKHLIEGLSSIHKMNCIHNDIKTENIIINPNNNYQIKYIDFGRGYCCNYNERLYSIYLYGGGGTIKYSSPEIFFKEEYSAKTDCFSLGMVIYEVIHNKLPYFIKNKNNLHLN